MITSTSIALLTERIAYRPFRRVSGLAPLICAFGVSFFLEQTFRGMFGSAVKSYPSPTWQRENFDLFGFHIPSIDGVVIVLAVFFMAGLYLIVQRTKMGTAMRAVSEDGEAAALMGIDVNKVVVFTFMLGGAMAGIAGVFYAFVYKQVYFFMGFTPGVKAFGAAVLGGIGNIPGAMLGGLFLGMVVLVWPDTVPRWVGHSGAVSVARYDRVHPADHGADLPPARPAGREAGEETRMSEHRPRPPALRALLIGLAFGAGAVHLSVVGVLLMLHQRWIVVDTLSLGQAVLVVIAIGAGAMAISRVVKQEGAGGGGLAGHLGIGVIAGAACGAPVALLAVLTAALPLQSIFIALSPALVEMLTLSMDPTLGVPLLIVIAALSGMLGAALYLAPSAVTRPLLPGAVTVLVAGVFQELIQLMLQQYQGIVTDIQGLFYTWEGLTWEGAIELFIIASGLSVVFRAAQRRMVARRGPPDPKRTRLMWAGIALLVLILMPALAGSYIGQVLMLVGLYILMGMGLNLEVGLAGLLDLGFVAFFAVGAYTTALLTADSPHALLHLSYWGAMPIAVFMSVCVGVLFGLPVLGVRGDYLAVATMGLGEDRARAGDVGFRGAAAWGAQGISADSQAQDRGFVTLYAGAAVLSDAGVLGRRGVRRVALGKLSAGPRLDGAARR